MVIAPHPSGPCRLDWRREPSACVIPAFPVYIFDVDGTLVDSAADICGAIQGVLRKTPQNAVSDRISEKLHRTASGRSVSGSFSRPTRPHRSTQWSKSIARIYPARDMPRRRPIRMPWKCCRSWAAANRPRPPKARLRPAHCAGALRPAALFRSRARYRRISR